MDATTLEPLLVDPFCLSDGQALSPEAEAQIVSIAEITDTAGAAAGADGRARHICRGPSGAYHLVDVGFGACLAVGAPVTFAAATDIASAILSGKARAVTMPGATQLLALAYVAALSEAQRRNNRQSRVSPGVQPANAAAPVPNPQPTGAAA